ncbi:Nephrocystin-4, partial [Rhizophlyctis rosea]
MLTTHAHQPQIPWTQKFIQNGRLVPYTPPTPPKPKKRSLSRSPSKHRPIPPYELPNPSLRYPYQLLFSKLEGLPIPPTIPDTYLQSSAPLALQIRASLFDLQTGCFFGRTWKGRESVDLKAKGRVAMLKEGKGRNGKVERRRRRQRSDSDDSDEDESRSESEDSDSEVDEDDGEEREEAGFGHAIQGHRVNIGFQDECLYLHTALSSPNVVAILEFVFIVEFDSEESSQDFISGGWTLLHLFDPDRNGLDLESVWGPNGQANHVDEAIKLMPIFDGTPRALPFIAGSILGTSSGYPTLSTIPGAMFSYAFAPRPDVRPACSMWRENVWVGPGDDVPGLEVSAESITMAPAEAVGLSQIRIRIPQGIQKYEQNLLTSISFSHDHSFPNSLTPTPTGTLPLPKILERRLHIGLHNSHTFPTAPTILTLTPNLQAEDGTGSELVFNGNVELQRYMRGVEGVAVVFAVEYKVQMVVNVEKARKSGLLG